MAPSPGSRERSERSLSRRGAFRAPRRSILIVCEGEKSETLYFEAMKADRDMGLTTVHVEIYGGQCGSAPISVVQFALQLVAKRAIDAKRSTFKLPFEQVFCVMDVDRHPTLDAALDLIERSRNKVPIQGIVSCPCFEFWYLLHFGFTAKPYHSFTQLKPDLLTHLPGYEKGIGIYESLRPLMADALTYARRLERDQSSVSSQRIPNPSTQVHILIQMVRTFAGRP